jgi:signal transduction histidine kinase
MGEPDLRQALTAVAERLRSELHLGAVLLALGREAPVHVEASAGDTESVALAREAAGLADMVLVQGPSPSAGARSGSGRWIRIVRPYARPSELATTGRVRSVPVQVEGRRVASLILVRPPSAPPFSPAGDRLLSAVAHQVGLALQRLRLQHEAAEAEALRRTDELRAALINAVSHDLRTPLSSILASAGSLLQKDVKWTEEQRSGFAQAVVDEARRLDRLVGNLLDLSRIESGNIHPERLVRPGVARERSCGQAGAADVGPRGCAGYPDGLPPVQFDYVEIDQVLSNLWRTRSPTHRGRRRSQSQCGR